MDDEFRSKIAASGHGSGTNGERSSRLQLLLEAGSTDMLELPQRRSSGFQRVRGGSNHRVRLDEREIVDYHANHLPVRSRERRYICWASSGRFKRS